MRNLELTHKEIERILIALEVNRDSLYRLAAESLSVQEIEIEKMLKVKAEEINDLISKLLEKD